MAQNCSMMARNDPLSSSRIVEAANLVISIRNMLILSSFSFHAPYFVKIFDMPHCRRDITFQMEHIIKFGLSIIERDVRTQQSVQCAVNSVCSLAVKKWLDKSANVM